MGSRTKDQLLIEEHRAVWSDLEEKSDCNYYDIIIINRAERMHSLQTVISLVAETEFEPMVFSTERQKTRPPP